MGDITSKAYEKIGTHTKELGALKCKLFKSRFKKKQRQNVEGEKVTICGPLHARGVSAPFVEGLPQFW